jgi:hypothetical protein
MELYAENRRRVFDDLVWEFECDLLGILVLRDRRCDLTGLFMDVKLKNGCIQNVELMGVDGHSVCRSYNFDAKQGGNQSVSM